MNIRISIIFILLLPFFINFSGCSRRVADAIDSRDLVTSVKMSDTVFLEPVEPEKQVIWIRVKNTSDQEDFDTEDVKDSIIKKMKKKGYQITNSPKKAQFRLETNILYADKVSKSLTADFAVMGGYGGALGGSDGNFKTMVGHGIAGALIGAAVGSLVKVNKYAFIVDIKISEKVEGGVDTKIKGKATSGGATGSVSKSQTLKRKESFLHHSTRIAVTAKQTNLELKEAIPVLVEKLSSSLSGVF